MRQLHVSDYTRRVELLSFEEAPKNAEAGEPVRSEGSSFETNGIARAHNAASGTYKA